MLLIICHPFDDAAKYFYAYCERRSPGMAVLVNADILTSAKTWELQLRNDQPAYFHCELHNGKILDTSNVSAIFNRTQYINIGNWKAAGKTEKNYAEQEFYAFFLGWLYSFKGMISNLPTAQCMSGVFKQVMVWRNLAAQVGMPVLDYDSSDDAAPPSQPLHSNNRRQNMYITGDTIIGHLPGMPAANLLMEFARQQECNFLELLFERENKRWKFDTANAFPTQFHTSQKCMETLYQHFSAILKKELWY
jgi:hypothetical protein